MALHPQLGTWGVMFWLPRRIGGICMWVPDDRKVESETTSTPAAAEQRPELKPLEPSVTERGRECHVIGRSDHHGHTRFYRPTTSYPPGY